MGMQGPMTPLAYSVMQTDGRFYCPLSIAPSVKIFCPCFVIDTLTLSNYNGILSLSYYQIWRSLTQFSDTVQLGYVLSSLADKL